MKKNRIILFVMAASLILVAVSSCTKETWEGLFGRGGSNRIQAVVSSSSVQTKAGLSGAGGRFLGTIPLDGFVGDSLCIAVYEFDNDDLPQELSDEIVPQTKGAVVSTSRINQNGQQFTMNAWLESSGRLADDAVHFMSATATRSGGSWSLASTDPSDTPDGPWNKWRNQVPTNFWAMYPSSLGSDQGTIAMSWPVDNAGDGAQKTATFDYTLPAPRSDSRDAEYQPDLCFAYSRKAWNESAPGNDNKVNFDFNHALSAVYFTTSGVLNSIIVNEIGFDNVPSTAHCEMTGNDGNPGTPDIKWTGQGFLKNYRQTYLSSDFEGSSKIMNFNESSKVFMMIPDSLAKNGTKLWAEFDVNGTSFDSSVGGGFSATKNGNSLRVTADARISVNRGSHEYWVNADGRTDNLDWSPEDWSSKGVIDLSRYDFENDTTSIDIPMTTANCYIIRHAGTYSIPLVYGNAIVNGVKNEQSYKPSGVSGAYALTDFKNSNNAKISSPFIENNTGQTASRVDILWQDEADAIQVDGYPISYVPQSTPLYTIDNVRYIQFTVPQNKICQNNALIAVTDAVGTVLWSWHIWTTNDPALVTDKDGNDENGVQTWIPVKNYSDNIYNFFPLPCLGWIEEDVYPARDSIQIVLEQRRNGDVPKNTITLTVHQPDIYSDSPNGCYYQFGRKDPMCRKDTPAYNHSDRPFKKSGVGKVSLADAIQHPEVFYNYGGSGNFDWCQPESGKTSYYNLWSGGYCGTGLIEQNEAGLSKTVYDPSPRGYKMPASKAFTGFTSTGSNTNTRSQFNVVDSSADSFTQNKGWNFYTEPNGSSGTPAIFFPAAGCRKRNDGARDNVGISGNFWSAVPFSSSLGHKLSFSSGVVSPMINSDRSSGYSARPVQE